jgi:hypothetical protein
MGLALLNARLLVHDCHVLRTVLSAYIDDYGTGELPGVQGHKY